MTASKIAPQRTFPKQLTKFVKFLAVVFEAAGKFETDAFFQRKFHLILRGLTEFQVFRVLTEFRIPVVFQFPRDSQALTVRQVSF